MATKRPNESSPLLPSRAPVDSESRSLRKLMQARYVLIPLLVVGIVGILWASSGSPARFRKPRIDSSQLSDADLLKLLPPFDVAGHPMPPKMINRSAFAGRAIPTNSFWSNLLVGDDHGLNIGAGPVTLSPYTVRSLPKRLDISYGDTRRVATNVSITEYFNVDAAFTGYASSVTSSRTGLLGDGNSTSRQVVAFDDLSVTVEYRFDHHSASATNAASPPPQWMNAVLARGSPYVTVDYMNLLPVLEFNASVYAINGVPVQLNVVEPVAKRARQQWTAQRFEIDVGVYGANATDAGYTVRQKWVLYFANKRTLQLQVANEKDYRAYNLRGELTTPTNVRLVDTDFYTGAARLAIVPDMSVVGALATLDAHANVYPVSTSVSTEVKQVTGYVTMQWTAKRLDGGDASTSQDAPLLLLANPHHVATFSSTQQSDARFQIVARALGHRTLKSFMTPVVGNTWVLEEPLPDVGFIGPKAALDGVVKNKAALDAIAVALKNDSKYTPEAQDPYYFGKEIARQARLVLIADVIFADTTTRDKMLDDIEDWVTPWLIGQNEDQFTYDKDWGGLCSLNGLKGVFWMSDFGNGWYNDHHFHYGYFLYALAVVAKFRPDFAATHKAAIVSIARDIASADHSDPYFPRTRHFSWFDGHSFASGVYALDGGKSQESVSEAINAYYGVYLLGKALQLRKLEHMGHLLLALETRAAQTYWQMPADSTIYESVYARNKMTGQVAATKVSYTTWFGPEVEHIHLINMIPFTPITPTFLSAAYVQEEFPLLQEQAFQRPVNPIDDRWRGYAYLAQAFLNPPAAWKSIQELAFFDDGSSRANSLFWVATRPAAMTRPPV